MQQKALICPACWPHKPPAVAATSTSLAALCVSKSCSAPSTFCFLLRASNPGPTPGRIFRQLGIFHSREIRVDFIVALCCNRVDANFSLSSLDMHIRATFATTRAGTTTTTSADGIGIYTDWENLPWTSGACLLSTSAA